MLNGFGGGVNGRLGTSDVVRQHFTVLSQCVQTLVFGRQIGQLLVQVLFYRGDGAQGVDVVITFTYAFTRGLTLIKVRHGLMFLLWLTKKHTRPATGGPHQGRVIEMKTAKVLIISANPSLRVIHSASSSWSA